MNNDKVTNDAISSEWPYGVLLVNGGIPADYWYGYLKMRERVLSTELNAIRKALGKEPKRCLKCGEVLK